MSKDLKIQQRMYVNEEILKDRSPVSEESLQGCKAIAALVKLSFQSPQWCPSTLFMPITWQKQTVIHCMSGDLQQAQTVWWWCPCDGPVCLSKTDTVSSPNFTLSTQYLYSGFSSPTHSLYYIFLLTSCIPIPWLEMHRNRVHTMPNFWFFGYPC